MFKVVKLLKETLVLFNSLHINQDSFMLKRLKFHIVFQYTIGWNISKTFKSIIKNKAKWTFFRREAVLWFVCPSLTQGVSRFLAYNSTIKLWTEKCKKVFILLIYTSFNFTDFRHRPLLLTSFKGVILQA